MNLKSYRTAIMLDDPETGERRKINLRIKRMTVPEGTKFSRDYYQAANPPSNSMICRKPDGEEQEKRTVGEGEDAREVYVISEDEIKARRLAEMSPEQRAEYRRQDEAEETFANEFLMDTLRRYVRVETGQGLMMTDDFEDENAEPREVRTGLDLANLFGGREDVTRDLLRAVHLENSLNTVSKKVLRPLFGFAPSSGERETDQVGQKPDQTAGNAENSVSVSNEVANPEAAMSQSGSEASIS